MVVLVTAHQRSEWPLTGIFALLVLGYAYYYTVKLIGASSVAFDIIDLPLKILFLVYSLGSILGRTTQLEHVLLKNRIPIAVFLCWAKVTTSLERVVVGALVEVGTYSVIILALAILGFLVPAYLLWQNRSLPKDESVTL
jgi:hypothetical protein